MNQEEFVRYLLSKRSVDDRALNQYVWQRLQSALPRRPLDILEIGSGIGTMVERLHRTGLLAGGRYVAVDSSPELIAAAIERVGKLSPALDVDFVTADVLEFVTRPEWVQSFDLIIAHAFLDLVNITDLLPQLFKLLRPGAHFYFTINFDGLTVLEPSGDEDFDQLVMKLYHTTMDERLINGRLSGHSQTGRRLLQILPVMGGRILAAGASDWIVYPVDGRYPVDEAFFLQFIIDTVADALSGHAELDKNIFQAWIARRHQQIDAAELVFMAHQIDIAGRLVTG